MSLVKLGLIFLLIPLQSLAQHNITQKKNDLKYVDEPKACLVRNKYPCALRFLSKNSAINKNKLKIYSSNRAVLIFYNKNELRMVEGKFWFQAKKTVRIVSGAVSFKANGDFWIEASENAEVIARNLNGALTMSCDATKEHENIPVGFENWYSGINSNGVVQKGLIKNIDVIAFLPEWYHLSKLPTIEAKPLLATYKNNWKGAIEETSEFYRQVIQRRVSSLEERENKKIQQELNEEKERKRLRQMFRDRQTVDLR